jgi:hypothetical protein
MTPDQKQSASKAADQENAGSGKGRRGAFRKRWLPVAVIGAVLVLIVILQPWTGRPVTFGELLLQDPENIDRIEAIRGMDTIRFHKQSGEWMMGEELLNQKAVDNLLVAASRVSMKSIVPRETLSAGETPGRFVFSRGKKIEDAFYLLKDSTDYYIFNNPNEMAFGIELMGYEDLSLEKIFSFNRDHYRVHVMIDLLPDEISRIRVQPISGTAFEVVQDSMKEIRASRQSAVLSRQPAVLSRQSEDGSRQSEVSGLQSPDGSDLTEMVSEEKIRYLFSYFNAIRYEKSLQEDAPDTGPVAIVEVEDMEGNTRKMEIFPWMPEGADEPDIFHAMVRFSGHRETLLVNYFYLDLLIRGAEHYFKDVPEGD